MCTLYHVLFASSLSVSLPPSLFLPPLFLSQHLRSLEITSNDSVIAEKDKRLFRFTLRRENGTCYTFKVHSHGIWQINRGYTCQLDMVHVTHKLMAIRTRTMLLQYNTASSIILFFLCVCVFCSVPMKM